MSNVDRLLDIFDLYFALTEVVKSEHIAEWLHAKNRAFGNRTPLQVILDGDIDLLWEMVYQLRSGQPT